MIELRLPSDRPLQVLCLGAHADDIEIGCGGTILTLAARRPDTTFHWVVLSGAGPRADEARAGAGLFTDGARAEVVVEGFRDGFFPSEASALKERFLRLAANLSPDLILTHHRDDRHQDHRVVSDLTWNHFRDHLVLEYEIPKWDGDMGRPNTYVALDADVARAKVDRLAEAFPTQAAKDWFDADTFLGLMRLRGLEARAESGFAEAFHAFKVRLTP